MSDLGRVCVVGAGQIGTSIGMALRASPAAPETVEVWDVDPARARDCAARGGADRALHAPEEVLGADFVVLAIPVSEVAHWVSTFGNSVGPQTLVIDTGSAKEVVVASMRAHSAAGKHCMGGHPICGNEGRGPQAADPRMLAGSAFVLTPVGDDSWALDRAVTLVRAVGARPLVLDATQHDEILAISSHLPHLLAAALLHLVPEDGPGESLWRDLLGPGFRGSTRLAASDPKMVASFLSANAGPLRRTLAEVQRELALLGDSLASEEAVRVRLESASRRRSRLVGDC